MEKNEENLGVNIKDMQGILNRIIEINNNREKINKDFDEITNKIISHINSQKIKVFSTYCISEEI